MGARRRQWKPGALVRVDLQDGSHTYGRLRVEHVISFYDARSDDELNPTEVVERPILFSVCVAARALSLWPEVAFYELPGSLAGYESFVKRDRLSGRLSTYTAGRERPVLAGEPETLEVAAVWEPEHIVDRLIDHYAGRPNKWVESLRSSVNVDHSQAGPR